MKDDEISERVNRIKHTIGPQGNMFIQGALADRIGALPYDPKAVDKAESGAGKSLPEYVQERAGLHTLEDAKKVIGKIDGELDRIVRKLALAESRTGTMTPDEDVFKSLLKIIRAEQKREEQSPPQLM